MNPVLFLNPPTPNFRKITRNVDCASESKGNYLLQPFDFLLLSGAFHPEIPIQVMDAVADRLSKPECLAQVEKLTPRLIITSLIDATWDEDHRFLSELRKTHPETPILVFGDALIEDRNAEVAMRLADGIITSPLLFQPSVLKDFTRREIAEKTKDLGLRSPGFFTQPRKTPEKRSLHPPRHELFLHPRYRWPFSTYRRYTTVITSWGCPYSCAYCTASKLPSLYREPDEILKELAHVRSLGIKEIYFGDKSFGVPLPNTREILQRMIAEDLCFSWSAYFHPNQYSPELLELMKRSGCHTLIIGIETDDLASLTRFNRRVQREKIEALIENANRLAINICGDFLFGLPDEDESTVQRSIDYALKLPLDYASFNIASPLPGSIIKTLALQDRRMREDDHHFDSVGKGRVLPSNKISETDLVRIRNQAVRRFYLRPKYLLKRIRRLRGLEHLWIQLGEMMEIFRKAS